MIRSLFYRTLTNETLNLERSTVHIMDDRDRIAMIDRETGGDTVIRYQLADHLGSSSIELDDKSNIISYEEYHPFGTTSYQKHNTNISQKRYKYTGKERDNETGMYYYGARYYAAWTCRFVSVDPLADKYLEWSPYVYCADNPIKYIDPDGNSFMENGTSVSFGFGIIFGSHNIGVTINASISKKINNAIISMGFGINNYTSFFNTGKKGVVLRGSFMAGYDNDKTSLTLGSNVFVGLGEMAEFTQRTGILTFKTGKFSFSYENDGMPFALGQKGLKAYAGDGNDKHRTASVRVGWGKLSAGFNLFTGYRTVYDGDDEKINKELIGSFGEKMPNGYVIEFGSRYRVGAAFIGYENAKLGVDSDRWVRHPIQDNWAHDIKFPINTQQPGFESLSDKINPFFQINTIPDEFTDKFTLYDF